MAKYLAKEKSCSEYFFWQIDRHMAKVHAKHSVSQKKRRIRPAGKQKGKIKDGEMRETLYDVKMPEM